MTFRLGHLSDIHVPDFSDLRRRHLLSKRLTGFTNYRWKRRLEYVTDVLDGAVQRLIDAQVDEVIVSGDLSNLGYPAEFRTARSHLEPLLEAGIPTWVVPGNHDRYVRSSDDGSFEATFRDMLGERIDAQRDYPWLRKRKDVRLVGVNSALATSPFMAWGRVGEAQLHALRSSQKLVGNAPPLVLCVHHHIGKASHKRFDYHRNLRDSDAFMKVARELGATLVLHGHNHRLDVRDVDGIRVFGIGSGISSRSDNDLTCGMVAIHDIETNGQVRHHLARWLGDRHSPWIEVDIHS